MTYYYATLAQIKANINTSSTAEDVPLLGYSADISERIDLELHRELPFFLPYHVADEAVVITPARINSALGTFALGSYWLDIDGVSLNDTALSDAVAYPPGATPIHELRLTGCCGSWYDYCGSDNLNQVLITGTQGYHKRAGAAWKRIGVLKTSINNEEEAIAVTGSNGTDISGENNPAFSAGCLFRIDDEYFIRQYSPSGVEVERAVHGTTAAAHTADAVVEVFQVERNIARVTARQAGLFLHRRGGYDTRSSNELGTAIVYPADLLAELKGVLQTYAHL